jgi:2-oxoglutarate dehydrogenase E1 component
MDRPDVDGLNTGYAALLLEQYLDNPGAVPEEWRDLFESEPELLLQRQPGLARLLELAAADGDGHAAPVATPPSAPVAAPAVSAEDKELLGGIAAAMALVKAFRMERYLRRAFLGQKQFSVEGLDVMIPMLDEAIDLAARDGAHEVVLGMAHRGRLNDLAHVVGRPYETILREFEGERTIEAVVSSEEGGSGDVKYHLGAQGTRSTPTGDITITLVSNPSHLEAVDPVVEGRARAEQTDRSSRQGYHDPSVALPVLIHGDASFAGQGSVAETLNLQALAGYTTGGTLHLISNNQVGFTTDPESGRSTR